jgi:hypothetical protein
MNGWQLARVVQVPPETLSCQHRTVVEPGKHSNRLVSMLNNTFRCILITHQASSPWRGFEITSTSLPTPCLVLAGRQALLLPKHTAMAPKVELAAEPVQRGKLLWTWEATISSGFVLGRFPTRMCIAGYPLGEGQVGLIVISPLEPTEAVVQWLQKTGQVRRCCCCCCCC